MVFQASALDSYSGEYWPTGPATDLVAPWIEQILEDIPDDCYYTDNVDFNCCNYGIFKNTQRELP